MAVAIVSSALVLNDSADIQVYSSTSPFTAGGGADHCLVALVSATQGSTLSVYPNTTVTYGGVAMTLAVAGNIGGNNEAGALIFYLMTPPTTAADTVVSFANPARGCGITIVELSGVDGSDPLGAAVAASPPANQIAIAAEAAGSALLSVCTMRDTASGPFTPTPDTTELFDYQTGGGGFTSHAAMSGYKLGTAASTAYTMGGTATGSTNGNMGVAAAEFKAAAAGTGSTGDLAAQEIGADASALAGALAISGALGSGEAGADIVAFTGAIAVSGALGVHETGADAASFVGTVAIGGSLVTQGSGADGAAIAGVVVVSGALATQGAGADVASFTGSVGAPGITGQIAFQETDADTIALAGAIAVRGALAVQESAQDVASLAGAVALVAAMAARGSGADNLLGGGKVAISGALVASEVGADTASLAGTVFDPEAFTADFEVELRWARPEEPLVRRVALLPLVRRMFDLPLLWRDE